MKLFRITLLFQSYYYLITALWPIVHIESFMAVSGPKTDVWLVKTVAVLLLAISVCFITQLELRQTGRAVIALAITCCAGLLYVDCYYAFNDIISDVYLLDGVIELVLLILWLVILYRQRFK
jgi:hypothetical protein